MLGDWLVVSQVLPVNPAAAVRGPKHVVTTGATPVLAPAEARRLLAAIDTGTRAGRRDRALVSVMLYSVARVSAVIGMRRPDYFRQERRGWLRLHEKGGKRHDVPAHHRAGEALDDYLEAAGADAECPKKENASIQMGWRIGRQMVSQYVVEMLLQIRLKQQRVRRTETHDLAQLYRQLSEDDKNFVEKVYKQILNAEVVSTWDVYETVASFLDFLAGC